MIVTTNPFHQLQKNHLLHNNKEFIKAAAELISLPSQKELYLWGLGRTQSYFLFTSVGSEGTPGTPIYLALPFSVAGVAGFSSSQASIQVTMASASLTK